MKKSIKTVISFMLVAITVLSLSSCTIFQSMRENAENAAKIVIKETPEKDEIVSEFNKLLGNSKEKAETVKESVKYSAGSIDIFKGEEEAGILDSAAKQLKNFVMSANPGSTSRELADGDVSLLETLEEASMFNFDFTRNLSSENVTDAQGKEVTDEEGNVLTTKKVSDNTLHLTFNYYNAVALDGTEYETAEDGKPAEETMYNYADDATIEAIFGSLKDKEAVLKNFESIKDYITVSDYEIEYKNCYIASDADLNAGTLSFVKFEKNMTVTAKAQGVGALEKYGEIEVVFNLTQTTNYEFTYAIAEEGEETSEDASSEEVISADETSSNETSTEETSNEEVSSEESSIEETTETVSETSTAA